MKSHKIGPKNGQNKVANNVMASKLGNDFYRKLFEFDALISE